MKYSLSLYALQGLLYALIFSLLAFLFMGCQHEELPPPVPPMVEDLSTWAVPELVELPPEEPLSSPLPEPVKEKPSSAEKLLPFAPATSATVNVAVGVPLDIILEPGEQVRSLAADSTTVEQEVAASPDGDKGQGQGRLSIGPWIVTEGADGQGDTLRHHIFLTVRKPGATLSLVFTTTRRVYYLTAKSVARSPLRVVRWEYPPAPKPLGIKAREPGLLPDTAQAKRWHVGYEVTSVQAQAPQWTPRQVLDDGRKMYLVMPEVTLFQVAPLVRMVGPNGPQLVNSRQFLNVIIIDQLAPRLELRVGIDKTAEVVTIARGTLRTIQCPGAPECPVWPAAVTTLARKGQP